MKFKLFLIAYFLLLVAGVAWLARQGKADNQRPTVDNAVTQIYKHVR